MDFFKWLFSPKRQRIIEAVRNYYNGKTTTIPYTPAEIRETINWVKTADVEKKEILLEKLAMAERIVQSKTTTKSK